jgi:hypothetical protein
MPGLFPMNLDNAKTAVDSALNSFHKTGYFEDLWNALSLINQHRLEEVYRNRLRIYNVDI